MVQVVWICSMLKATSLCPYLSLIVKLPKIAFHITSLSFYVDVLSLHVSVWTTSR